MKKNAIIFPACTLLAVLLWSGCASTRVVDEWRNEEVKQIGPYGKLFLAAITEQDPLRRKMEGAFQAALADRKVAAVPSYESLPAASKAEKEKFIPAMKNSGADAALVFHMVKKETRVETSPGYHRPNGLYSGYQLAWSDYYAPSSVYEYDIITLEARLYDVAMQKLVWVASTETRDPVDVQKALDAYAKLICDRMARAGILSVPVP